MLAHLKELFAYMVWADEAVLQAATALPESWQDERLRWTLHHIVLVQRAFMARLKGKVFDLETEKQVPPTLAALAARAGETHAALKACLSAQDDRSLGRAVELPWFAGKQFTAAQCLTQVVLHTQNHRGQALTRLRELGAKPPMVDYIVWLQTLPTSERQ